MAAKTAFKVPSGATVIRVPSARPLARRAKHHARRALSTVSEEKHTLAAVGAGAALGLLEREGIKVPVIGPLGTAGTVGVAAWLVGKFMKSRVARHVATGALSIAAYELARGSGGKVTGDDDEFDGAAPLR